MSIIKRINKIQNLDQLIVNVDDTSENSPDFFNVFGLPAEFPAGKTSFLINGSDNLVINSEVRIEILDPDRNVIYTQPIQFLDGVSRLISVFVYPDDSFGEAILTLVGEVFRLPEGFRHLQQATGNQIVRWQRKILINPSLENISKIRFFRNPRITVTEVLRPYLVRTFGGGTSTDELTDGTISGQIAANEYVLTSKGFDFRGQMVGATVFVSDPNISDSTTITIPYTTSITEVKNSKIAIAEFPYQIQTDEEKALQTIEQKAFQFPPPNTFNFLNSPYTMSILTEPTFSSTQNIRAFAKVRVANMTPFSGDVNLVKLYMKSEGSVGDFELVADQVLESVELLVDSSSIKFNTPTGYFFEQLSIDSFWSASQNDLTVPSASLIFRTDKIIDSMLISGSDERLPIGSFYKIENTLPVEFDENAEYTFEAQYHAVKKQAQELLSPDRTFGKNNKIVDVNLAKIQVYISGSAFVPNPPGKRAIGEKPEFGKLIQEIELASNSIPNEKTIGTVEKNFTANRDGDGTIIFIVEAGDWHIHNVTIKIGQETGFSPDLTTFFIPIPDWEKNDPIKFKAEFYDINNNRSTTFVTSSELIFEGGNSYIGGTNNLLTGSLFIGNLTGSGIEMAGVDSAFVRTVGYKGFVSASRSGSDGGPGGFMFWSGTVTLGEITNEYAAVGFEVHGGSGSAPNPDTGIGETHAMRFRTDTGILEITGAIVATFLSASAGEIGGWAITTSSLKAISGSMELFSDGQIFTNNFVVNQDGAVTASQFLFRGGRITGSNVFIEIPNFELDATNIEISSINASMSIGEGDSRILIKGGTASFMAISQSIGLEAFKSDGIFLGFTSGAVGAPLSGALSLESTTGTEYLRWDGTNLEISTSVLVLTTSSLQIQIDDLEIDANNFELSTANASMSLGEEPTRIIIKGQEDPYISIQQTTKAFGQSGVFLGSTSGFPQVSFENPSGSESLRWDGFKLIISASGFSLDETGAITASAGIIGGFTITDDALTGNSFFISGSPSAPDGFFISASNFNVRQNGDITGSSVFFDGGTIAGWQITPTLISGSNLLIDPLGTIQTADFISDLTGWRITSAFNGLAEFENAKIRGTLSTVQFVKESVNVVGGQLWIANSTQLSGSATASTTSTTFSVDNSTAWEVGEIAIIKRFDATGFSTEYIQVVSSSLEGDGEATFNGKLFVLRNIGGGIPTGSDQVTGSLSGDTGSAAISSYSPGQTIVSTGRIGTGYIRANANPRDFQTPYIDIIERTGSGVYDLDLKVRIGDLKGINPSLLFGNTDPGFGIFTENGFFRGTVTAVTGSFIGIVHAGDVQIGTNVGGIGNGLFINSNNYWLDSPNFRVGGPTNFLSASETDFKIKVDDFELDATNIEISSVNASMSLGEIATGRITLQGGGEPFMAISQSAGVEAFKAKGIFLGFDNTGGQRSGTLSLESETGTEFLRWDGTNLEISTSVLVLTTSSLQIQIDDLEIDANNFELSTTNASMSLGEGDSRITMNGFANPFIAISQSKGSEGFKGDGIFLGFTGSDGVLSLEGLGSEFLRWNGTKLTISASGFSLDSDGNISASNAFISGTIQANAGEIGGFTITGDAITSTNLQLVLSGSGEITASNALISGTNVILDVQNFELNATNIEISSQQASMSFGEGRIVLSGSEKPFIAISQSSFGYAQAGIFLGFDQNTKSGSLSLENSDSDEFLRWDGRNLYISTSVLILTTSSLDINLGVNGTIEIDALNFELSTVNASMSLGEGDNTRIIQVGATNPFISIGQGESTFTSSVAFDKTGIFLGLDSGVPKLSLRESLEPGAQFLRWTGTSLEMSGTIRADAGVIGLFSINTGSLIGGTTVGSQIILDANKDNPFLSIGQATPGFREVGTFIGNDLTVPKFSMLGNTNSGSIEWDGESFQISASNFQLNSFGQITASDSALKGITSTENVVYKRILINTSAKATAYIKTVHGTGLEPSPPATYSILDLSSEDLPSGIFIRIESAHVPIFPIGFIYYPRHAEFDSTGFLCVIETPASTLNIARSTGDASDINDAVGDGITGTGQFPDIGNRRIGFDSEDWSVPNWKTTTILGTSYTVFNIASGMRTFLINNDLDFKLQASNRYESFQIREELHIAGSAPKIGIGTTSPQSRLHIRDPFNPTIILDTDGIDWAIGLQDAASDRFFINTGQVAGNQFTILTDGKVGIGTSSPTVELDVVGDIEVTGDVAASTFSSLSPLILRTGVTERLRILDTNGYVGLGTTIPGAPIHIRQTINDPAIVLETGGTDWFIGVDNSTSDRFKINTGQLASTTTPAFVIESSGFVGFGTSDPRNQLDVHINNTSISPLIRVHQAGMGDATIQFTAGTTWFMGVDNSDSDKFKIVNSSGFVLNALVIDTSQNVGIGIATPGAKLEVNGAIKTRDTSGTILYASTFESGNPNGGSDGFRIRWDATNDSLIFEKTDGNAANPDGSIDFVNTGNDGIVETALTIEGDGGIFMPKLLSAAASTDVNINGSNELHKVVSSKRYKRNISDIEIDTAKLYNLRPTSFEHTEDPDNRTFGLIAEEVFEEIPQLVVLNKKQQPESVKYSMLSVLLLNELKKKDEKIKNLEKRLEKIEQLLKEL